MCVPILRTRTEANVYLSSKLYVIVIITRLALATRLPVYVCMYACIQRKNVV